MARSSALWGQLPGKQETESALQGDEQKQSVRGEGQVGLQVLIPNSEP